MLKTLFLSFFLCTSYSIAQLSPQSNGAKNLSITGLIIDSVSYENLEFVSVRLISLPDSSTVGGALSDSSGRFTIEGVSAGNYNLKVSFIGYNTKEIFIGNINDSKKQWDLGRISMRISNVQTLGEVKVVGQLDVLKAGIDKKVYNVGEDLNNQGGSASDVLNNVPSVDVDQDGNVSLRGDGNVIILIDGRPSAMAGSLSAILGSLPANSIERIELVTNPSAKYDPDGTSGIINIVLKKNKLKGFNGEVSLTGATGNQLQGSATLSYRNNKFIFLANYANSYREGYRDFSGQTETRFEDGSVSKLVQSRPGSDINESQNFRFGVDYNLTDNQLLGVSANYSISDRTRFGLLTNEAYFNDELERKWERRMVDPSHDENLDLNAFYKYTLKEDLGEFSVDFRRSQGSDRNRGTYTENYLIENGDPVNVNRLQQHLENTDQNVLYATQADYSRILKKWNARVEAGAKHTNSDQNVLSFSEAYDYSDESWKPDTLANFTYRYQEQISAVYGIFGQAINRFKYQVGLRGEYALQRPILETENIRIDNTYYNLFPSGHLRYSLTKKQEISLGYSRRINRARSRQLNPFTNYSDPNNLRTGNPYLKPEYVNSYDLAHSFESDKLSLTSSIFFRQTTGVIQRIKVFYPNNLSAVTYDNIDESRSYGFEMVINYKPYKWWRNTFSMNGDHMQFIDRSGVSNFNNSGYNLALKLASTFDFWKRTASIQINTRYNTPRITPQGKVKPRQSIDISGDKKLGDNKWTIGFRVSDIFNTRGFEYDFDQVTNRQYGNYKWQTRRVYLTVSYRFGKYEVRKGDGSGDQGGGGFDF